MKNEKQNERRTLYPFKRILTPVVTCARSINMPQVDDAGFRRVTDKSIAL